MSIHTWPEFDFAALDIFVCGTSGIDHPARANTAQPGVHAVNTGAQAFTDARLGLHFAANPHAAAAAITAFLHAGAPPHRR